MRIILNAPAFIVNQQVHAIHTIVKFRHGKVTGAPGLNAPY